MRCLLLVLVSALSLGSLAAPAEGGEILFESGTLGPTGISGQDVFDQIVLGSNVGATSFVGSRFELLETVRTTSIGGHFVLSPESPTDTLFGTLVHLEHNNDFPDSADLSSSDVIDSVVFEVPTSSGSLSVDLQLDLEPGWYAVVFGSGLFGATGRAAALRNNVGFDSQHIGFIQGAGWGTRQDDLYFSVEGIVIPEPSSACMLCVTLLALAAVSKGRR